MLKIRHYLNNEGHFYLCVQWKMNAVSNVLRTLLEVSGGFAELSHVKADSHVSGNRIRPKRKSTICYSRLFLMTVFIRRAPVKHNIASECIRTVAATYSCEILQLYQYDANVYGSDKNCE